MTGRRVVVTGLGAVTPVGTDAPATWAALVAGRSGVRRLTTFDPECFPVQIAGIVEGFDPRRKLPHAVRRRMARGAGFAVAAAVEAVADAGLDVNGRPPSTRRGVAIAGSVGRPSLRQLADVLYAIEASGGRQVPEQAPGDVVERSQNLATSLIAQLACCAGPTLTINTACAASIHSVGEGFRRIQEGEADIMVSGGYDALTSYLDVIGFSLLGALNHEMNDQPQRASRPFDRDRAGFVLGEGAVFVVLEAADSAKARGVRSYAEVRGYGTSLNAYRITDSPPDGVGAILAMRRALDDGGLDPDQIDCVVAHGTSTPGNDLSETVAIKAVFGAHARRLAITAPKSMTGHLTAAAGALNVLVGIGAIRDGMIPPTINLEHPDPKLDLDYVPNRAREKRVRAALINAFAFGGTNACLVLATPDHREL